MADVQTGASEGLGTELEALLFRAEAWFGDLRATEEQRRIGFLQGSYALLGVGGSAWGLIFVLSANLLTMWEIEHLKWVNYCGGFVFTLMLIGSAFKLFGIAHRDMMLRRRLSADRRAVSEASQVLRETIGFVATREGWSVVRRAEFEMRLARFSIRELGGSTT